MKGLNQHTAGTAIERLLRYAIRTPGPLDTDCWISGHSRSTTGYAQIRSNGRNAQGHRLSYEHHVGPIPDGLQIDHLCRNRPCVNPAHMEVVTSRENTMRGLSPTIVAHLSDICLKGHSLNDAYIDPSNGRRYCRVCRALAAIARRQAA